MKLSTFSGPDIFTLEVYINEDRQLVYALRFDDEASEKIIEPSNSDWEDFRDLLDKLKVWDWEKEYDASKTRVRPGARITQEAYDARVEEIMSQTDDVMEKLHTLLSFDEELRKEDALEPMIRIMDGGSWGVSIEYEDRQIKSKGHNAYPCLLSPKVEPPTTTGDWVMFREGVSKLVGGNAFW